MTTTLTIGILTLNEEKRIAACLQSAAFADQIILLDSGSSDQTLAIAKEIKDAGMAHLEIYSSADWQGFAIQRNRLLTYATGDFIFFLDADELITPAVQHEIQSHVQAGTDGIGVIQWNQVAYGRELTLFKSTGGVQRLFKRRSIVQFEGVVHEGAVTEPAQLPHYLLKARLPHYSRETIHDSLLKLAQYSHLGALKRKADGKTGGVLRGMVSGLGSFVRLYFLRRGFLCGAEGFLFCVMVALESFFRYVALKYDADTLDKSVKRS